MFCGVYGNVHDENVGTNDALETGFSATTILFLLNTLCTRISGQKSTTVVLHPPHTLNLDLY
jgi:hypothetical protein